MTSTEANQFLTENGRNLAAIGITVTAVGGVGDTHIHVEHKTSGAMPVLLGDLAAVMNFTLGLQFGLAVAARQAEVGLIELEEGK